MQSQQTHQQSFSALKLKGKSGKILEYIEARLQKAMHFLWPIHLNLLTYEGTSKLQPAHNLKAKNKKLSRK